MKTLNEATIIGHVGQDPIRRETESGKTFLPVSIATHVTVTPKEGEKKQYTEWHNVVFWNQTATLAHQMLRRGTPVFVRGHLRTYKKYDANNAVDRFNTVIVGENFIVLSKKDQVPVTPEDLAAMKDDDLPL